VLRDLEPLPAFHAAQVLRGPAPRLSRPRQAKGISGPEEARDAIVAFLDTHSGVEAYVEPKTAVSPLTVLFVDGAGEAKRFPLNEDALLRELAKTRGLPVFDATRVGYPERMRRRRDTADG
jgi:hypothetical protein